MIDPKAYDRFLAEVDACMRRARALGLYRTTERLHTALNEARSERFEACPPNVPTVTWRIGPVGDEPIPSPEE